MPWIGIEYSCPQSEVESFLKEYGYIIKRTFEIELFIREEWRKFKVYEVLGFAEGVAEVIAETFNCPALEAGPHLVLGEISAKLWDEAAKVVMPTGEIYIVPVYTYDGFLDVKMPTSKVRGLKGQMIIRGKAYDLPLAETEILSMLVDKNVKQKIDKAIAVYGASKIISKELLDTVMGKKLGESSLKSKITYEIDPDTKIVLFLYEGKLTSLSLPRFIVFLVEREMFDDIENVLEKLDDSDLRNVYEVLREYSEFLSSSSKPSGKLEDILKKLEEKVKK